MADLMPTETLTAGHGTLTAVRAGQKTSAGRDLVVLHSLLADRHAFDPVLPQLAARHRVTLFNLTGFKGGPQQRQQKPQPGEEASEVIAGGGEDGVVGVAV